MNFAKFDFKGDNYGKDVRGTKGKTYVFNKARRQNIRCYINSQHACFFHLHQWQLHMFCIDRKA